jgi:hypothetical protein
MLLKYRGLVEVEGVRKGAEKGGPQKNDVQSREVIENNRGRFGGSYDIYESKGVIGFIQRCL